MLVTLIEFLLEECYSYLEKIELKKKLLLAKKW
jgi:hypothetical protein